MTRFDRSARIELWTGLLIAFGAIDTSKLTSATFVTVALGGVAAACAIEVAASSLISIQAVSRPPIRWFALWVAWAAGSALFAPSGPDAVLTVGLFAVIGAAVIHISTTAGEIGLARTILGGFAVLVGISLVIAVAGGDSEANYQGGRLALLTLEANQLVRMAAIAALASAYLLLSGSRSRSVPLMFTGAAGLLGSVFIAIAGESRTGSAALIIGLIVFVVALAPRSRQRAIAGVGAAALLVGLAIAAVSLGGLAELFERAESAASREDGSADSERDVESLNGRLEIWPEILTKVDEQPISGHGLGNDREIVTGLFANGRIGWMAQHTHNLALQVLLTTGLVGLALMAIGFVSVTARVLDAGTPLAPALLVLILVDGITEAAIRVPSFGWFALIAAAAVAAHASQNAQTL